MTTRNRWIHYLIVIMAVITLVGILGALYLGSKSDALAPTALCIAIALTAAGFCIIALKQAHCVLRLVTIWATLIISAIIQDRLLDSSINSPLFLIIDVVILICAFGIGFALLVKDDPSFLK